MHIFTITAGRTGTDWLSHFIRDNLAIESVHESLGYDDIGTKMPDIRVMRNFNEVGMTDVVNEYWQQKVSSISGFENYCETNHTFTKSGLIEFLSENDVLDNVVFINQRRNWVDVCASYIGRRGYFSSANVWQWLLDWTYKRKIINPSNFAGMGDAGYIFWFLAEMEARQEYYKQLYSDKFRFIDCRLEEMVTHAGAKRLLEELGHEGEPVIPGKKNATKSSGNDNLKMKLNVKADRFKRFDPAVAAAKFIEMGGRLGTR